jgi:hypothetical protein
VDVGGGQDGANLWKRAEVAGKSSLDGGNRGTPPEWSSQSRRPMVVGGRGHARPAREKNKEILSNRTGTH